MKWKTTNDPVLLNVEIYHTLNFTRAVPQWQTGDTDTKPGFQRHSKDTLRANDNWPNGICVTNLQIGARRKRSWRVCWTSISRPCLGRRHCGASGSSAGVFVQLVFCLFHVQQLTERGWRSDDSICTSPMLVYFTWLGLHWLACREHRILLENRISIAWPSFPAESSVSDKHTTKVWNR